MFEAGSKLVNQRPALVATIGQLLISGAARLARRLESTAFRLALPGVCGLCGGPGQWARCRAGLDLCVHCEAALPVDRGEGVLHAFSAGAAPLAAFAYAPPVDHMIRQLKFRGDRSFARTLGILLAERRAAQPTPMPDLLLPVPVHFERLRERGYNQALELARVAGRRLGIRVMSRVLVRTRATPAQSMQTASRRADNVRDCFAVTKPELLVGKALAIVDDVLTTGSTAAEAMRCVVAAGAARVEVWVAARAGGGP